jgi:hypothetical protein
VSGWGSYSYVYGPLVAVGALSLLVLVLRWSAKPGGSLIERRVRPSDPDDYGMLVAVSMPRTYADGEMQRLTLEDQGVRATLATTVDGPRLMVFPDDEERARAILRPAGPGRARG